MILNIYFTLTLLFVDINRALLMYFIKLHVNFIYYHMYIIYLDSTVFMLKGDLLCSFSVLILFLRTTRIGF